MAAEGAALAFIRRLEAIRAEGDRGRPMESLDDLVREIAGQGRLNGDLAAMVSAAELVASLAQPLDGAASPEAAFYEEVARRLRASQTNRAEIDSRRPAR